MLREKAEAIQNNPSPGRIIGLLIDICTRLDKIEEEKCLNAKPVKLIKK